MKVISWDEAAGVALVQTGSRVVRMTNMSAASLANFLTRCAREEVQRAELFGARGTDLLKFAATGPTHR